MPTPDIPRYYRRALILPVVLSVAGWVITELHVNPRPWLGDSWWANAADTLAWTGLFAVIPYALFVVIAWVFFRPEGAHAHRRMAALAPAMIAVSLAAIIGLIGVARGYGQGALSGAAIVGGYAFAIGTVHSLIVIAVVELVAAVAGRGEAQE